MRASLMIPSTPTIIIAISANIKHIQLVYCDSRNLTIDFVPSSTLTMSVFFNAEKSMTRINLVLNMQKIVLTSETKP